MIWRPFGQGGQDVPFSFPRELISVKGNNKEIADIFADGFAVVAPEGRNCVEQECKCVHTKVPELLVLVSVALF